MPLLLRLLSFALLGGLTARRVTTEGIAPYVGAVVAVVGMAIGLMLLRWALFAFNPAVAKDHGYRGIKIAVGTGFMMMFPFAVLAAIAEVQFGWNAVQAFAMAGIMTSGAAAGVELVKLGGGRLANAILPMLGGMALSTLWALAAAVAPSLMEGLR